MFWMRPFTMAWELMEKEVCSLDRPLWNSRRWITSSGSLLPISRTMFTPRMSERLTTSMGGSISRAIISWMPPTTDSGDTLQGREWMLNLYCLVRARGGVTSAVSIFARMKNRPYPVS